MPTYRELKDRIAYLEEDLAVFDLWRDRLTKLLGMEDPRSCLLDVEEAIEKLKGQSLPAPGDRVHIDCVARNPGELWAFAHDIYEMTQPDGGISVSIDGGLVGLNIWRERRFWAMGVMTAANMADDWLRTEKEGGYL